MNSVDRALGLLRFFSIQTPEYGLSALARASGNDKTTTLRCLTALERNGLVEQHPETKKYRIGIAPLHLSRIREKSYPVQALLQPILERIALDVGETAHASLLTHRDLVTVSAAEPNRATRVFVDPSLPLPFHATASGLAMLAFLTPEARADLNLPETLEAFTDGTPRSWAELAEVLATIRITGISRVFNTYEDDVVGTAVPFFGWSGKVIGVIAVAAVASRFDDVLAARIEAALRQASVELTQQIGG
ncbi:IclR family transcriptional regulator [Pararhodobacter sp.]|uniref:IclR family transcriptional regulator n=1 Tax=Pararhodobacter sp. TaxID=2127056 RepID=UPI002B0001AC|nr:IclR family transcriptional regulator [Pararhodobacter sp.]